MPSRPRVKCTKHGRGRMIERGISEDMVVDALMAPSLKYIDIVNGTTVLFKRLNRGHLMMIYIVEDDEIKLVTTFITDAAERI
jgi:ribosomal protein L7Ae-like RNA K-turn-binding protein